MLRAFLPPPTGATPAEHDPLPVLLIALQPDAEGRP
jgi:hypothetical protein